MLSYSKINDIFPLQVRTTTNYETLESVHIVDSKKELYLESSRLYTDANGDVWAKSPLDNLYYEVYRKNKNKTLITMFPTMYAEVTSDCKAGLALYENHDFASKEIMRKKSGDSFEITSDFFVDDRNNIWVRSINIQKENHKYCKIDGWVVYKTRRNNFLNLYIHGKYNVLTSNGELDENKVSDFEEYIASIAFNDFYRVAEPLQLFSKQGNVKSGGGKSVQVLSYNGPGQAHPEVGSNGKFCGTDSERKYYSFNGRKVINKYRAKHAPAWDRSFVQNSARFPSVKDKDQHPYEYNYFMNYDADGINDDIDDISKHLNYFPLDPNTLYNYSVKMYNRFKLANPADILSRGFAHVFFTRPDCNLFSDNKGTNPIKRVEANPNFKYALCNKKELLYNLCQVSNTKTANPVWNYILSNKALSFSLTDESISVDKYGKTYHGDSIAFGRSNNESKAAGEFTVTFQDTRDLDIFHIHKLWVDYISNVYIGRWYPKHEYLWQRILDYACSVYYIITAEDGETILFWSKYYGCFPTNIPSSAYGWTSGSPIESQKLDVQYQYSFKEDFNPQALVELNLNTGVDSWSTISYVSTYNKRLGSIGTTWVGSPFIETIKEEGSESYSFKLRFREGGK